jgi:hypothetical protein
MGHGRFAMMELAEPTKAFFAHANLSGHALDGPLGTDLIAHMGPEPVKSRVTFIWIQDSQDQAIDEGSPKTDDDLVFLYHVFVAKTFHGVAKCGAVDRHKAGRLSWRQCREGAAFSVNYPVQTPVRARADVIGVRKTRRGNVRVTGRARSPFSIDHHASFAFVADEDHRESGIVPHEREASPRVRETNEPRMVATVLGYASRGDNGFAGLWAKLVNLTKLFDPKPGSGERHVDSAES